MSNLLYNEGKTQEYILGTKHALHPTVPAGYMSIRQRCFLCKARTFIVRLNATARLVKYAHSVRIASTNSNTIARMWMWMWVSVWMRAWMQIHAQLQVHLLKCRIESSRVESSWVVAPSMRVASRIPIDFLNGGIYYGISIGIWLDAASEFRICILIHSRIFQRIGRNLMTGNPN